MAQTYIIGNWKMNNSKVDINTFSDLGLINTKAKYGICPQSIFLDYCVSKLKPLNFMIGSQNISENECGAFTGELNTDSVKSLEADFTLVGHSERRSIYGETDEQVNKKVLKSLKSNLTVVLCVGETLQEREEGRTMDIVIGQLSAGLDGVDLPDSIIIAYEPVWAIGTGKTATSSQAQEVHASIRVKLEELYPGKSNDISILYGGSVKPSNIGELLSQNDINGALVGGASLKAESFKELCEASQ